MKRITTSQGFTLLEVLVAAVIFGMISVASMSILNTVTESDRLSKEKNAQIQGLQRLMIIMEQDFFQASYRHARINGEKARKEVMMGEKQLMESDADGIAFVHDGWRNPAMQMPRSELQPVAYRLKEGKLERLFYPYVDPVTGEEPRIQVMLDGVEDLTFKYYHSGKWQESWVGQRGFPLAVSINIKSEHLGELKKLVLMPDPVQTDRSSQEKEGE